MKRILIADDHAIIRSALKTIIQDMYEQVVFDEASDGESTLILAEQNEYDLLVMDINMPNTDSFSLLSDILALKPGLRVLIFSMNAEELYAKRFLKLGAMGYLRKDSSEPEIRKAVESVMGDNRYISDKLRNLLTEEALGKKAANPFEDLSAREFEVLRHLVKGESVTSISQQLSLHTSTIGTHKARIFDKLGVKNIVDISTLAKVNNVDLEA